MRWRCSLKERFCSAPVSSGNSCFWLLRVLSPCGSWSAIPELMACCYSWCSSFPVFLHWHRIIFYGPLLLAGIFAAPIAQLENLLLVNREITARLQQLHQAIQPDHLQRLKTGTSTSS